MFRMEISLLSSIPGDFLDPKTLNIDSVTHKLPGSAVRTGIFSEAPIQVCIQS